MAYEITYVESKKVYEDSISSTCFAAKRPLSQISKNALGRNIAFRLRRYKENSGFSSVKFNEKFIREFMETDMILFAKFLFEETSAEDVKLYLKIRWRF